MRNEGTSFAGLRGVCRCGGAARGAGVYLLAETGGRPVVWGWPPMPEDGRPKKGRMCMSAVEKLHVMKRTDGETADKLLAGTKKILETLIGRCG